MTASKIRKRPVPKQLVAALTAIDSAKDMRRFLRDVMIEKEINEISARLEVARMLGCGMRYNEITEATKLRSRTVARISE